MSTSTYAHPEVLVDTSWVLQHHKDSMVRIAEVDYDLFVGHEFWAKGDIFQSLKQAFDICNVN